MIYHGRQHRFCTPRHSRLIGRLGTFFCVVLLLAGSGATQTFFEDVTEEAIGVPETFWPRSIAFGDYDNDGWPDVFLSAFGAEVALWHNQGENNGFADRTAAVQTHISTKLKGGGAIFGDYDNDGDLDLYVPVGMWPSTERALNIFLRNDRVDFSISSCFTFFCLILRDINRNINS